MAFLMRGLVLVTLLAVGVVFPLARPTDPAEMNRPALTPVVAGASREGESPHPTPTPAAVSPQPSPAPQPTPPPVVRRDASGLAHTDSSGDGTWETGPAIAAPDRPGATVHRYVLRVEGGTGISAAQVGPQIHSYLNDPRGWPTTMGVLFEAVSDPEQAEFSLNIATPHSIDQLCAPMTTRGSVNCRNGATVNINADRWNYLTPWNTDADSYHTYVINHEVGHWLGHGHERCQGSGLYAPVMMQQSGPIAPCVPNGWSTRDNQRPS